MGLEGPWRGIPKPLKQPLAPQRTAGRFRLRRSGRGGAAANPSTIGWQTLIRGIVLCLLMTQVAACATTGPLSQQERAAVQAGETAVVLLRTRCTIDGQPREAFPGFSFSQEPLLAFGLGTFETIGEPRWAHPRFFSDEARRAGWAFFVLPPGTYYLAVLGPDSVVTSQTDRKHLREAPRWRFDIPANSSVVYIGTLEVGGQIQGHLLFGNEVVKPLGPGAVAVSDDGEEARRLLAEVFPAAADLQVLPLQRWRPGEPIVIRAPIHPPAAGPAGQP